MRTQVKPAIVLLLFLTILTGLVYPLGITAMAQLLFPHQANGSLLLADGRVIGSSLIGQPFNDPKYFWSRPSATPTFPYNGAASSGSNLGPTNPALFEGVKSRISALRAADPGNDTPIPVDLVTASGSGLDPHISPAAAIYQLKRVSRSRGLDERIVYRMIEDSTENRQWGLLGERRVNVLLLNLALDRHTS